MIIALGHDRAGPNTCPEYALSGTPIRVVCNNTLMAALGNGHPLNIRHDLNMADRLEQAKRLLGLVN